MTSFGVFVFLALLTGGSAHEIKVDPEDTALVGHGRVKRSNVIGDLGSVVCNRTIWKGVFEPYLHAEGLFRRDPTNYTLEVEFNTALDRLNSWKDESIEKKRVHEACGLQQFLECGENLRCICGTGPVPYNYVAAKEGGICLATRGSHCRDETDCTGGLVCQDRYCGGSAAFLEEMAKWIEKKKVEPENSASGALTWTFQAKISASIFLIMILRG